MPLDGWQLLPVLGTTRRLVDCGRPLHRVPDERLFQELAEDIERAVGDEGAWYACIMLASGRGACNGVVPTSRMPPGDVLARMIDLAVKLNGESHHYGHWVILWVNGFISSVWRGWQEHAEEDKRSVILLVTDLAETWARARLWTLDEMADRCEGGYQEGIVRYRQS
jgi:hypothetical protein